MSGLATTPYHEQSYTDGFFDVSGRTGFLPIRDPLAALPERYAELQQLMVDMPTNKVYPDVPGVLSRSGEIVDRVAALPDYTETVKQETDIFVWHALYRAFTFLCSAYTLEASHHSTVDGIYGRGRSLLPGHVARPLVWVAEKLDVYPYLDYHYAYSLGNYVKIDPTGTLHWKNLDMACKFSGTPDEIGFIMLHVYINELSPKLVDCVMKVGKGGHAHDDMLKCAHTMMEINSRRKEMWAASRHERYNDFRIFIMGIKGNEAIYGDGLVYDTCFDNVPQTYRGQTGAQDSLIPMMDIFSGVVDFYPENKLTEYLLDLRTYRPKCVQQFFIDLRDFYGKNPLFSTLVSGGRYEELVYLLKIVDEIYLFRNGHWQFVQKYIMANTKFATATGGTPITSWLINQIEAVLRYEGAIIAALAAHTAEKADFVSTLSAEAASFYVALSSSHANKTQMLHEQVAMLQSEDVDVKLVYETNIKHHLEDAAGGEGTTGCPHLK